MSSVFQHKIHEPHPFFFPKPFSGKWPFSFQRIAEKLFHLADIEINGARPWDIHVHDPRFFRRVLTEGSTGLGEAYMDEWWDCQAVDACIFRILRAMQTKCFPRIPTGIWLNLRGRLFNLQTVWRAFQVGRVHYDAGDHLYELMLDQRMIYSCGYWPRATNIDEAQEAKLDLVCQKLGLTPGMEVLDIGCGWGGFLKYAAERYGIRGVGVTISRNQYLRAKESCRGLPVDIRFQDYRDLYGRFDRVVSIGMFEHVGYKNYGNYMRVARRCLTNDGLFLLHTITNNVSVFHYDAWMEKYIFPNALVPSMKQIAGALEGVFVMEDCHNLNTDYDRTLMAWEHNFERGWTRLSSLYNRRFYRMWRYYLLSCAGAFRSRNKQVWQLVLSPRGVPGGYRSLR